MSSYEPHHEAQRPEPVHQADQGGTAAQARARYLQMAGGGLVAAYIGHVTKDAEVRNTRDGKPWLVFGTVADAVRPVDDPIRVEYFGHEAESLAPRLVKGTQIYAEGRLTLNTWTGKGGAECPGLRVKATHIEILSQ